MMIDLVLVGLWLVGIVDLIRTLRGRSDPGRVCLSIAGLAATSTITLLVFRSSIDSMTGISNVSGLLGRMLTIVGMTATDLAASTSVTRRHVRHTGVCAGIVAAVMLTTWMVSPLSHERLVTTFSTATASSRAALVYSTGFYVVVWVWAIQLVCLCATQCRHRSDKGDRAGAAGLTVVMVGLLGVAGVMVLYALDSLGMVSSRSLRIRVDQILILAVVIIIIGMVFPLLVRWVRAELRIFQITPAWRAVTASEPAVVLQMRPSDRVFRPDIVLTRRLMEIDDARAASPTPDDEDAARLASRGTHRPAAVIGRILSPPYIVCLVWVVACLTTSADPRMRLSSLAVGLIFLVAGPYLTLAMMLRSGAVSDAQVVRRGERHWLYSLILAWVMVGVAGLVIIRAPWALVAVAAAMFTGLGLVGVANLVTKASFHLASLAGAAVVLCLLWWPAGICCAAAIPVAGWARVNEGRHSWPQVVLGAVLGGLGGASYLLYTMA